MILNIVIALIIYKIVISLYIEFSNNIKILIIKNMPKKRGLILRIIYNIVNRL